MPILADYRCNWLFASFKSVVDTYFRIDKILTAFYSTDIKETEHWSGAQLIIKFSLSFNYSNQLWIRHDLVTVITAFGGIMALLTGIIGVFLSASAEFDVNYEMTRELYTVNPKKQTGKEFNSSAVNENEQSTNKVNQSGEADNIEGRNSLLANLAKE